MEPGNEEQASQPQEQAGPPVEVLEKISLRTNYILGSFFSAIRSDEKYNEEIKSGDPKLMAQIEASALMQAASAIATSVMFTLHNQGLAINVLLEDHVSAVKRYLAQAEGKQNETKDEGQKKEDSGQDGGAAII